MKMVRRFLPFFLLLLLTACSSLNLRPGDFGWPIETVLKVDNKGYVEEQRYSFTLKVKKLFWEEFADSTNFAGKEIRMIRDKNGFYFVTGVNFKNVYVFEFEEGGLSLEKKIQISEKALSAPAFNQKSPGIELIDGSTKYLLNNKGIVR